MRFNIIRSVRSPFIVEFTSHRVIVNFNRDDRRKYRIRRKTSARVKDMVKVTYRLLVSAIRRRQHPIGQIWWRKCAANWDAVAKWPVPILDRRVQRIPNPSAVFYRCISSACRTAPSKWRSRRRNISSRSLPNEFPERRKCRPVSKLIFVSTPLLVVWASE